VICHNDLAPRNFLHKRGEITGLVDWDVAAPGARACDLAYFAYSSVPLAAPENRAPMGRPADPAIPHRMTLVRDSYGCSASLWADVIAAIPTGSRPPISPPRHGPLKTDRDGFSSGSNHHHGGTDPGS
jgi:hypothetical protein